MEPPSTSAIHILNRSPKRIRVQRIREAVEAALPDRSRRDVEILLTTDAEIRTLNRQTRNLDETTDVLSFPAPDFPEAPLGEIAISVEYAEKQAAARGIAIEDELCYLAIHGTLHLLGMDDEGTDERAEMFAAMHRIGLSLGLPEQLEWMSILGSHSDCEFQKGDPMQPQPVLSDSSPGGKQ